MGIRLRLANRVEAFVRLGCPRLCVDIADFVFLLSSKAIIIKRTAIWKEMFVVGDGLRLFRR